jgi:GT2 family glycosyltransferase
VTPARIPGAPRSPSISVVLVVYNQIALTRACLASLRSTARPFELCVVDNASTDETPEYFAHGAGPARDGFPGWSGGLRYRRNPENVGLIRALNQGASLAGGDALCFLHNDTEMLDPCWLDKLAAAVAGGERVGLAGLYGARRLRRDGRYAGRSIVHCVAGEPGRSPVRGSAVTEVAAVDGVCLFLPRAVLAEVGGFDEGYGFFHGYDRDLSFAVRATGRRCVVVHAPFLHRGGGTRTGPSAPVSAPADLTQRREALAHFARKWRRALPADVRTPGQRILDRLRRHGRGRRSQT